MNGQKGGIILSNKKISVLVVFLTLIWSTTPSAFAAQTVIAIESVNGKIGDTVDVPVSISGNPGVSALVLWIGVDADYLEPIAVTKTELLQNGLFVDNLSADRNPLTSVNVTWANTSDLTADGLLYTISFRIKRELPGGVMALQWDAQKSNISNEKLQLVDCVLQDGEITSGTENLRARFFLDPLNISLLVLLILGVCVCLYLAKKNKAKDKI